MKQNSEKFPHGPSQVGPGPEDLIRRGARQVIGQAIDAEFAQLLGSNGWTEKVTDIFFACRGK